jgi:hypothetical protein
LQLILAFVLVNCIAKLMPLIEKVMNQSAASSLQHQIPKTLRILQRILRKTASGFVDTASREPSVGRFHKMV